MHLKYRIVMLLVALAAVLVACGDKEHFKDLRAYIETLHRHPPAKPKTVPENPVESPAPVSYKATTLRVPFVQSQQVVGPQRNQSTNPLQAYPLNVLRFVGTISRENIMYAYIVAPDGIVYEVKEGDHLGDRYGKVSNIVPNQVSVKEQVTGSAGQTSERTVTLQLKDAN